MEKEDSFINSIFSSKWMPFIIILILGIIVYIQTFFFNFSYLDDNNLILANQSFLSHLSNVFYSFTTDVFHMPGVSAFYYRPILSISLIFDYHFGGVYPFIYHFTNVAIHIISSCLLFVFLCKLNYKKVLSLFFAIVFLVHPVLSQAVAWIPGRNDSLLAVFILATFIFFIKYLEENKIKNIILSLLFLILTVFTKESGVFILPLLFFYSVFIHKDKKLSYKDLYFFIGGVCVIALWFILRHFALLGSTSLSISGMIKSVYMNMPAVVQFIGKIFLPFNLSVLPIIEDTTFVYGIIAILLLFFLLFFTKKKRLKYILFGFGWFLVFLLPSFIRPNTDIVADFIEHRVYVPIIGIMIILLETDFIKRINWNKKNTTYIAYTIIFILSLMTMMHSRVFVDRISFWENAVKYSPHYPLTHRNLGAMRYLDGDLLNAEIEFKEALKLNKDEFMAHSNLGLVYANTGRAKEAEEEYKKEIEINPYYDNVYYNLGLLYWQQGKKDQAIIYWKKTLEVNPDYMDAIQALAVYYYDNNDYTRSLPYMAELYNKGVRLPDDIIHMLELSTMR